MGRERKGGEGRGGGDRGSWTPQIYRWIDAFGSGSMPFIFLATFDRNPQELDKNMAT